MKKYIQNNDFAKTIEETAINMHKLRKYVLWIAKMADIKFRTAGGNGLIIKKEVIVPF